MTFSATFNVIDTVLVVQIEGKILNDEGAENLLDPMVKKLPGTHGKLVIDIKNLSHINSSGINLIIKSLTKARVAGGDLVLCGVNESILNIFKIAKMDEVFTIVETQSEAISILNSIK